MNENEPKPYAGAKLQKDDGLLKLLRQQYREAEAALKPLYPIYANAIDSWRGQPRYDQSYYSRVGRPWFTPWRKEDPFSTLDPAQQDIPDIYVREVHKAEEVILSRVDKYFLAPKKPFAIKPPKVLWAKRPPTPEEEAAKALAFDGATAFFAADWEMSGHADRMRPAFRDALLLGTGFVLEREAPADPHPHAVPERLLPWDCLDDPLNDGPDSWRFFAYRQYMGENDAVSKFPGWEKEIREAAIPGRDGMQDSDTERREVLILHYWGWYDPKTLESLYNGPDDVEMQSSGKPRLMRLWVLANNEGPTDVVLQKADLQKDFGLDRIPITPLTFLKDPLTTSCRGEGIFVIARDDEVLVNALTEALLLNLEFSANPGGFYAASFKEQAERATGGVIRPNEWRAVNTMPGQKVSDVIEERRVRPLIEQIMGIRTEIRQEASRKHAVQDFAVGMSTPTNTDTLGEVEKLQNESNDKFRFIAKNFDMSVKRIFRLHVVVTAKAIRSYQVAAGEEENASVWFRASGQGWIQVDPSLFDEPWEIELFAGSTALDNRAKINDIIFAVGQLGPLGVQFDPDKVWSAVGPLLELDPESLVKDDARLQMEQEMARLQGENEQLKMQMAQAEQAAAMAADPMAAAGGMPPEAAGMPPEAAMAAPGMEVPPGAADLALLQGGVG